MLRKIIMKMSEFLRTTTRNFSEFCRKFFGDNPEQYVEVTNEGALEQEVAIEIKDSGISKSEGAELIKALRDAEKKGDYHTKAIDASIKLDSEENGYSTTSKAERETSYRDSETMKNIRDKRNDVSAKDLPNIEREHGGEARTRGR